MKGNRVTYRATGSGMRVAPGKAAAIVACGGMVEVIAEMDDVELARVSVSGASTNFEAMAGTPRVNWPGYGPVSAERALIFRDALNGAAEVAAEAESTGDRYFSSVPPWVRTMVNERLAREDRLVREDQLQRYAAQRYQHGDVDYTGAWVYAAEKDYGKV